tara:strand:- start:2519 stop:2734 length:216 start_codon:yes stop_codon:yes gene_type:complete
MNFLKKVIKKIMDLKTVRKSSTANNKQIEELTPKEIDFLLQTIANSTFEGKDVQIVYETAVKLQKLINKKS